MANFLETVDVTNPDFIKQYEGKLISTPEGVYNVQDGQVGLKYTKEQLDKGFFPGWNAGEDKLNEWRSISQQLNQAYQWKPEEGLETIGQRNTGTGTISDMYRYYKPAEQAQAQTATQNFGMGTGSSFRPRAEGESMETYLQAKQAAGVGGVDLGTPNMNPTQAEQEANWVENQKAAPTEASNTLNLTGANAEKFNSLTPEQQKGIVALSAKPSSTWTPTDIKNWNYATNNAPLPKDATLISPSGEKKVVVVGSPEASNLLKSGWGLSKGNTNGSISPDNLQGAEKIPTGDGTTGNGVEADVAATGATATADQTLKDLQNLFDNKENKYDEMINTLLTDYQNTAKLNTGRGTAQAEEEARRGISGINTNIADKNAELTAKLAEIKTLDAVYQRDKGIVEEKVVTMGRMAGQLDKEYKKYLLEKNLLTSQASALQADVLGLQGKLEAAQKAADRAVDLKYLDITQKLDSQLAQINALAPFLEREDKNYANAVTEYLNQKRDNLNYQRDFAKAEFSEKLQLIGKYGVGSTTDSMETLLKKVRATGQYAEENRVKGDGSSAPTFRVGNEEISETGDTFTDTVNYLKSLRNQGLLNDVNYNEKISALMENSGYDEARRGEMESAVNNAMAGRNATPEEPQPQDNNPASDFVVGKPEKPYAEQGLGTFGTTPGLYYESLKETSDKWNPFLYLKKGAGKAIQGTYKYLTGR